MWTRQEQTPFSARQQNLMCKYYTIYYDRRSIQRSLCCKFRARHADLVRLFIQ